MNNFDKRYISVSMFAFLTFVSLFSFSLATVWLLLITIWYIPKINDFFINKIDLKNRIINDAKKQAEKMNVEYNEKMTNLLYRFYDVSIRILLTLLVLLSLSCYFVPIENYSTTKPSTYNTVEQNSENQKQIKEEQNKNYQKLRMEAKKLLDEFIKNDIVSVDINSLGQNIYYFDEDVWENTKYKNKNLFYEAMKILNSTDNGEHYNLFYVKGSYSGKTLVDIFGVR